MDLLADSAKSHFDRGYAGLALGYYKRALKHAQTQKLPQHQAKMLLRIAATLPRQDADSSLNYLDSALRIAKSIHHYQLQSEIYHSIVEVHKQHHNYTAALFALEAHDKLTDSLLNERRTKELQQLQVQKNAAQERAYYIIAAIILSVITGFLAFFFRRTHKLNGQLAQAVAVRNKLFSIISHDLRGPAASLNQGHAMIGTGAISVEELPEFLNMLENQSKTLNETLDSLLMWSRTQLDEIQARPIVFPLINCLNINIELL
ncbi:MAG: hypothetical protein MUP99_06990, partial [Pedobacter sp.]|nr:hypothetical protein [Pedobacter sp.]